ncbi:helix-turn-helix domain-containing protein [Bdellovibrio bacteriovorus]|uniref:MerR family transcriptional regulator n=1 Tax=Bdellovibrio bacteriovorus TaxID=959 RepID=UPI0035A6A5E3
MNQIINLQEYLRIKEASKLLGVHPDTLRRWEDKGLIKPMRHPMNRYRLYKREELSRFFEGKNNDESSDIRSSIK